MTRGWAVILAVLTFAMFVWLKSVWRDYRDYRDEYATQAHLGALGPSPTPPLGFMMWVKYLVSRDHEPDPEPDPVGDVDQPAIERYDWGVIGREDAAPRHSAKPGPARNEHLAAWVRLRLADGTANGEIIRNGVAMFGVSPATVKRYIRQEKGEQE
jgi:hypothetical protein